MITLGILLAIVLAGISFLVYCFLGFSQKLKIQEQEKDSEILDSTKSHSDRHLRCLLGFSLLLSFFVGSASQSQAQTSSDQQKQIDTLRQEIRLLEDRIAKLENHSTAESTSSTEAQATTLRTAVAASVADPSTADSGNSRQLLSKDDRALLDFLGATTINVGFDGYYAYNFNHPGTTGNQLRAYDVSSNSFSINQADIVIEQAPDLNAGRRFGARLDLQYGQATETLQGSSANELRPQAYRNLWQAYGTYVVPIKSGLTVDFGKWASSLGVEGNYTKDQINYSRSYFFNYLPFYHMGLRATYNLGTHASITGWLVNGAQQTEDFNNMKSAAMILTLKPATPIVWNINYYTGQEQRSTALTTPNGREHIFDTYATWTINPKLAIVGEADYVVNRVTSESSPSHVVGGAAYLRYQANPRWAFSGRTEYLSDRGGLFSGSTQALKEVTATAEYKFADGLLSRAEWRRDFSNIAYFATHTGGRLSQSQSTATLGLVWWLGRKQGSW